MALAPAELRRALSAPLPGHAAYLALSGYPRPSVEQMLKVRPAPRESAVLILIHPVHGVDHTLLMKRPIYPGVHSGQISFPGGRREPGDGDIVATALREFEEETGARTSDFEVVGRLSQIPIPPSRSLVTPIVAWASALGPLRPDPREVAALLHVPLSEFLLDHNLRHRSFNIGPDGAPLVAGCWQVQGETVWGATALMVAELRTALGHPLPPNQ